MLKVEDVLAPANRLTVLRAERRAADGGWTQTLVARAAGISPNRYWRIENRESVPTAEEKDRLSEVFGVSKAQIFPKRKVAA